MFIWAVVSYVSVSMEYTTWTPQMYQYDYRAHEEAYPWWLIFIDNKDFCDYLPFKIQSKKLQIWECDTLFKIGQ